MEGIICDTLVCLIEEISKQHSQAAEQLVLTAWTKMQDVCLCVCVNISFQLLWVDTKGIWSFGKNV